MFGDHQVAAGRTGELGEARSQAQAALAALGRLFSPFATVVAAAGEGEGGVVAPGRGSQVRSGLAAGGNRIRTLGPALHTYRFGPPSCRFRERAKFAVDSLLEGGGFEPSPRSPQKDNDVILTISLDGVRR